MKTIYGIFKFPLFVFGGWIKHHATATTVFFVFFHFQYFFRFPSSSSSTVSENCTKNLSNRQHRLSSVINRINWADIVMEIESNSCFQSVQCSAHCWKTVLNYIYYEFWLNNRHQIVHGLNCTNLRGSGMNYKLHWLVHVDEQLS